jgi:predicted nucleotidyltransferase
MVDEAIIKSVRNYLGKLIANGLNVSFGVVFGSYVTGGANEWSDIDLVVVSPEFDGIVDREKVNKLWHVAARTDSRIEPIACGLERWEKDDSTPIIEVARQQGLTVTA